jgi:hypothetical protein
MIHQQIGVRPLGARLAVEPAQVPISLFVDRPLGPQDRPRPPSAAEHDYLDSNLPHSSPAVQVTLHISTSRT